MLQKQIISIAQQAGEEILKFYRSSDLLVENKRDNSPVTKADLIAHEIIFSEISKISKEPIISEESELNKNLNLEKGQYWLVDPLDGTRDFVAGRETFCVSIGLIQNSLPVLGVLYSPVKKEFFWAAQGQGSFFNGKKIFNLSARTELFGVASGVNQIANRMKSFLDISKIQKMTRYGSALKFASVASGEADIYPRFGETSEWDTAAGQIICSEAGCDVIDIKTAQVMKYSKPAFRNTGFIALRRDLVPQFQKILKELVLI